MSITLLNCVWFKSILAVLYEDCFEKEKSSLPTHEIHCHRNMSGAGSSDTFCKKWKISHVFQWLVFPIIFPIQYVTEGIIFEYKLLCKQILPWSTAVSMISFTTKCTWIKSLTWDELLTFVLVARSEWSSLLPVCDLTVLLWQLLSAYQFSLLWLMGEWNGKTKIQRLLLKYK